MAADAPAPTKDELETPAVSLRPILLAALGLAMLVAACLGLLAVYFSAVVPHRDALSERTFPSPRLETSIDPRMVAAVEPGPATPKPPRVAPAPSRVSVEEAMRAVAARGARGYDPIAPAPTGARP